MRRMRLVSETSLSAGLIGLAVVLGMLSVTVASASCGTERVCSPAVEAAPPRG